MADRRRAAAVKKTSPPMNAPATLRTLFPGHLALAGPRISKGAAMTRRTILLAATALSGIAGSAIAGELSFAPVSVPADDAAKRAVVVSDSVTMDGVTTKLAYRTLFRSGDKLGDAVFGQMFDKAGKPVSVGQDGYSTNPDFTSLIPVGGKLFSLTHFENLPATMYLSELETDAEGNMKPMSTRPLDFSALGGLWNPCAGVVTPWNTHLGSEEYPQDARKFETAASIDDLKDDEVLEMAAYFGLDPATMTLEQYRAAVNPYHYGFAIEVTVGEAGDATIAKHYSMGRVSVELAKIMPDRKTAYISDDGTNVGLFRYVADKEGDLSAGQLFAAKWVQTSAENGGAANLEWVDLGHAEDATIASLIAGGTTFSDIFETGDFNADGTCPEGFLSSNAEGRVECLKVKPGMEAAASRLETRRYASMLGATTEFRKMEGAAFNPDRVSLYLAMSEVAKGMTDADEKADKGGRNDVRLAGNACGAVYEIALDGSYVGTTMSAIITGKPAEYAADSPYAGNQCDIDGIANPDNITYIPGYDTLIIGEDTGSGHQNDAVWALNLGKGEMTRIATTPYGAEATSVDWYPNLNGHGYLTMVVQHPYGESDEDKAMSRDDARGYVGYVGPFPALTN
jgi:secreted PhoX family phosphatase